MATLIASFPPITTKSFFMCMWIREGEIFTNCLEQWNSCKKSTFAAKYKTMFQ